MKKIVLLTLIIFIIIPVISIAGNQTYYTTKNNVEVKIEAGGEYRSYATIAKKGSTVTVCDTLANYYKVYYSGRFGYVDKSALEIAKETSGEVRTPIPKPTENKKRATPKENPPPSTGGSTGGSDKHDIVTATVNVSDYDTVYSDLRGVLSSVGRQTPDKCLDYSARYNSKMGFSGYKYLASNNMQDILKIMFEEIKAGRPCIVRVNGRNKGGGLYSRHFVSVAGVKKTATLETVKESDFLILDPATAAIKGLATKTR